MTGVYTQTHIQPLPGAPHIGQLTVEVGLSWYCVPTRVQVQRSNNETQVQQLGTTTMGRVTFSYKAGERHVLNCRIWYIKMVFHIWENCIVIPKLIVKKKRKKKRLQ